MAEVEITCVHCGEKLMVHHLQRNVGALWHPRCQREAEERAQAQVKKSLARIRELTGRLRRG